MQLSITYKIQKGEVSNQLSVRYRMECDNIISIIGVMETKLKIESALEKSIFTIF